MNTALLNGDSARVVPLQHFGRRISLPTVAEIDTLREQARNEGYAQGLAEAVAQAQALSNKLALDVANVLEGFSQPLMQLDKEVKIAVVELAVSVAGVLAGQECSVCPDLVLRLVESAIADLGRERSAVDVRLHPDDAHLVAELLQLPDGTRVIVDPSLARGDCRVHTGQMRIDASLGTRMRSILDDLMTLGSVS
jgi:flagellar assembly protein FliH